MDSFESKDKWTKENEFRESFRLYQKWAYKKISGSVFGDRILRVGRETKLGQEWISNIKGE